MEFDQGWGQGGESALLPVGLSCCSLLNSRSFWEGVRMMSFSRWASGHLGSNPTGLWGHPHVPALWLFLSLKAALARGAWTQARPASYPTCLGPEKVRADSPQGAVRLSPCSRALADPLLFWQEGDGPSGLCTPRDPKRQKHRLLGTRCDAELRPSTHQHHRLRREAEDTAASQGPAGRLRQGRGSYVDSPACAPASALGARRLVHPHGRDRSPIFWATGWRALSLGPEL